MNVKELLSYSAEQLSDTPAYYVMGFTLGSALFRFCIHENELTCFWLGIGAVLVFLIYAYLVYSNYLIFKGRK